MQHWQAVSYYVIYSKINPSQHCVPGTLLNESDQGGEGGRGGGATLRLLPNVVQQLKMLPRADIKSDF